jgi:hypothetical protein
LQDVCVLETTSPPPPLTCPEGTRAERGSDLREIGVYEKYLGIAVSHPSLSLAMERGWG